MENDEKIFIEKVEFVQAIEALIADDPVDLEYWKNQEVGAYLDRMQHLLGNNNLE